MAVDGIYSSLGRMARGGYGLPKALPVLAMPNPLTPCGRAISETALHPFQGWLAPSAGGPAAAFTPLDAPRRTPMIRRLITFLRRSRMKAKLRLALTFASACKNK
jgi:hypothetical protein